MNNKNRLRKAVECEHHITEIPLLAKKFRDEGMKQLDMYFLFEEFFIECNPNDLRYDSLVDILDAIVGGSWAKGSDLYASELTNTEIEENRKESIDKFDLWIQTVDNNWVKNSLIEIENCFSNPNYVWDAIGFGRTLSFARFFISVRDNAKTANSELDLSFLNNDRLFKKLVYALKNMLEDWNSKEQLESSWEELANDIKFCLSKLENLER